jgi:hypothetical protein
MLASISSGASAGTKVRKCCPDCMTEPTDTLATDCTVASDSARNSTSSRLNLALFSSSRASLNLRVASDNFCDTSARQPWM